MEDWDGIRVISGPGGEMEAIIPICMALMIATQLALSDQHKPGNLSALDQEQAGTEKS
jgi:hypothetical protein